MTRAHSVPIVVVALALAGCGGEDKGRPSAKAGASTEPLDYCAMEAQYSPNSLMIGAFEPRGFSTTVACDLDTETGDCTTYFNYDQVLSFPSSDPEKMPICPRTDPKEVPPSGAVPTELFTRCDVEERGAHFVAKNMATCINPESGRRGWGGSFDMTFPAAVGICPNDELCEARAPDPSFPERLDLLCPSNEVCADRSFDASQWDGIYLWVKKNAGIGGSAIIVSLADIYTGSTHCDMSDPNALMPGMTPVPDTEKCDSFGTAVTLTDDWTFIPIYFDSLYQKGFGKPSPLGRLDTAHLIKLQVLLSSGDWDFLIDDVGFFAAPN